MDKLDGLKGRGEGAAFQPQSGAGPNWIVDALQRNVDTHPHWPVYRFLDHNGNVADFITCYGAMHAARSVADFLLRPKKKRGLGLKRGDRVALVYPPGLEFVKAMWGCLFADIVAVPVPPPDPTKLKEKLPNFRRILKDSGAKAILTDRTFFGVKAVNQGVSWMKALLTLSFEGEEPKWPQIEWHVTNDAARLPADHDRLAADEDQSLGKQRHDCFVPTDPPEDPDKVAYLQYTSGSTGDPKGVMVTHGNLYQHNEAGWDVFFHAESDEAKQKQKQRKQSAISGTHMLLWLPHFHDFCLTVGILGCGMKGYPLVLMSPLDFIWRPTSWLEFMARHETTHTVAPDFAFGLVTRKSKPEELARWDLSSLKFIMSGAEPIRSATMNPFFEAFAQCGVKASAFCSAYGLAEHVCGATSWGTNEISVDRRTLEAGGKVQRVQAGSEHERKLFSCGVPMTGVDLRIVCADSAQPCEEGHVGEIWLSSPCVTAGYYNRPAVNQKTFQACVAGEEGSGKRYLKTGDLGFMFQGELYVTGRLKDMMILRGRNIYPNDIEDTIRANRHEFVPSSQRIEEQGHRARSLQACFPWLRSSAKVQIRPGGLAAFPVEVAAALDSMHTGEEGLVVIVELENFTGKPRQEHINQLIAFVRRMVMAYHNVPCHAVVIGTKGTLSKTTSGKVTRSTYRAAFEQRKYQQTKYPLVLACSEQSPPCIAVSSAASGVINSNGNASADLRQGRSSVGSLRTADSGQSSGSASEAASDSESDSCSTGFSELSVTTSPSKSDPGTEATSAKAGNAYADYLRGLPEDQQLGKLRGLPEDEQLEKVLDRMVQQVSEELRLDDVHPDNSLLVLGLDSAGAVEFAHRIEEALGLRMHFTAVLNCKTLRELATHTVHLLNTPDTTPIGAGVTLADLVEAAQHKDTKGQPGSLLLSQAAKATGVPCSPAQLYFLGLEQTSPDGADQNVVGALRLKGALSQAALQDALHLVMRRHDALRTHFVHAADGTWQQVVQEPEQAVVAFACEDAAALPLGDFRPHSSFSEAVVESLPSPVLARLQSEAGTPFKLEQGPLVRALMVKLGREDHLLMLNMHHAICDGCSFGIMLKEVSTAYTALKEDQRVSAARNTLKEEEAAIAACNALTGDKAASSTDSAQKGNEEDTETQEVEADGVDKEPCLPVVQLQYPDFATWQASQVQSATLQGQVDYWKTKLANLPELKLPSDFDRKDGHGCCQGGWVDIAIPDHVVLALQDFAPKLDATLYMLLLSSLKLLLAARSCKDDIVVASPFVGRADSEMSDLVGCCINTLVMRTNIKGRETLGDLVTAVKETATSAFRHAEAPLHTILQALGRTSDNPLFSVEFNFLDLEKAQAQFKVAMDDLNVESYEVGTGTATSDYYLVLEHVGGRITGRLEYNAELFSHATAQRMAADWQMILEHYAKGDKAMLISDIKAKTGKATSAASPMAVSEE